MFRNKWKISFFVSILLLISSNLYWLIALIDQGVTNTYLSYEYDDANKSIKSLGELIVKGAAEYNQKDILHLLRQANPDSFIVEEENVIITEFARFTFDNGKLVNVQ
ncbi:hypothetical protein HG263_00605 [Pseudoalteromonas sp. JBTF-M23]|uniref:Uncharacterized protein n=1 Tax=Pseudoalteromonas caenipelagi TaxID=2726988 RepID=A0A849V8F3_9GAMM|nr:hypothetical protein [Pseudoalteromonas caenipelagi]NOU49050.1 hypothetical protein [Pseudoalteromonas caenipelagi]